MLAVVTAAHALLFPVVQHKVICVLCFFLSHMHVCLHPLPFCLFSLFLFLLSVLLWFSWTAVGVSIDKSDPSMVEGLVGQQVVLPCRVSPLPSSTVIVEWRRDGVPVDLTRSVPDALYILLYTMYEMEISYTALNILSLNISQNYYCYCIFDRINAVFVSRRDFFQKHTNDFTCCIYVRTVYCKT